MLHQAHESVVVKDGLNGTANTSERQHEHRLPRQKRINHWRSAWQSGMPRQGGGLFYKKVETVYNPDYQCNTGRPHWGHLGLPPTLRTTLSFLSRAPRVKNETMRQRDIDREKGACWKKGVECKETEPGFQLNTQASKCDDCHFFHLSVTQR